MHAGLSRAERKAAYRAHLRDALPRLEALAEGLGAASGARGGTVVVLDRMPNEYASSFPSEIVTCRIGDGPELRLVCKYADGSGHSAFGHRGNVAYEGEVYRKVLRPVGTSAPRLHGTHHVPGTGEHWLVIEYIEGATRLEHTKDAAGSLPRAARWIGAFHRANERRVNEPALAFLSRYDAAYLRQWAQRTARLSAGLHGRFPWLPTACARFEGVVEVLLGAPTVIHGEYAPKNILLQGKRVCPVDWESAALAPGEVDLAALCDGWPAELVDGALRAYAEARWPAGAPPETPARLDLARLYWHFRWLGERTDWTTSERGQRRMQRVHDVAVRAGLL